MTEKGIETRGGTNSRSRRKKHRKSKIAKTQSVRRQPR